MSSTSKHAGDHSLEDKRALLAQLLRAKASRPRVVPLSFAQQRLWFLNQLDVGDGVYNLFNAVRLAGTLDLAALQHAHDMIVRRHETLRTTFDPQDGQPVQVIAPSESSSTPRLRIADLRALPAELREACMEQLAHLEAQRPFDLRRGPLLRFSLFRLGAAEHVLLLVMHHIISDGWSLGVGVQEIAALYAAFRAGQPAPLPALSIQYADFAIWQRNWLQGDVLAAQLAYWRGALDGAPTRLSLPTDRPRPAVQTFHGATRGFEFPAPLAAAIRALNIREGVTLFMTMLAAYGALLARYSGQADLLIGTPIANRHRSEIEGLIGFFVNSLVMRVALAGDPSFRELAKRVRDMALGAYAHQDMPFEKLVEALAPERDASRSPLFQVVFTLQNAPLPPLELPDLTISSVGVEGKAAQFDLTFMVLETGPTILGVLEYNTDLFDTVTVARMAAHLLTLVAHAVAAPNQPLSTLPLLTAPERQQVLLEWNDTASGVGGQESGVSRGIGGAYLHELIAAQAARTPDAIALVFDAEETNDERRTTNDEGGRGEVCPAHTQHLTYAELDARANRLAQHLRALGVGPETLVAVCLERSPELLIALLGVLKAGGAYLPLDPAYPAERLEFMLADSGARVIVTASTERESGRAGERENGVLPFSPSPLPSFSGSVVDLNTDWPAITRSPAQAPLGAVVSDNLVYVIYTSGSTGRPKGAMNTHRAIANRLRWMQDAYALAAGDRVLQKTPVSFDVSVWELFWPLMTGAALVLARPGGHQDPIYLARQIAAQQITTLHFVPSMLRVFLDAPGVAACRGIKRVICSGEALSVELQARFLAHLDAELHNLYGPTEAAVDVTAWPCAPARRQRSVPIGRPIANTRIYLLDRYLNPVPAGVTGELHIGGVQLARGYLNRPELTAARFIPNPFVLSEDERRTTNDEGSDSSFVVRLSSRLYRTGDLARYRPDGVIEYLGRSDGQIKLRGVRIELGEIEATLRRHPSVREAAVLARADDGADPRLVAYVVPTKDQRPTTNDEGSEPSFVVRRSSLVTELRSFLAERLPNYMLLGAFVLLDALPLTPSGKLDRRALPAPDAPRSTGERPFVAPRVPTEEQIAAIWRDLLRVERVGIYDDFFELGGHSLLLMQLAMRIQQRFGVELSLRVLFDARTIADQTLAIAERQMEQEDPAALDQLLDELQHLSPDEIKALLGEAS